MALIKGAIPKPLLEQQAFTPLIRKCDQYRKGTLKSQKLYGYIVEIYQRQLAINERTLVQLTQIDKETCPDLYKIVKNIFSTINSHNKQFIQTIDESHKQMANCFQSTFLDLSNFILNFQQLMSNYQNQERQIVALSKKYFKDLKNIETAIQYYKQALADVKLVYNDPEKIKRYQSCELQFEKIVDIYNFLDQRIKRLATRKNQIAFCYQNIQNEFMKAIKAVGIKTISEAKNFIFQSINRVSIIINKFIQGQKIMERSNHQSIFSSYKQKFDPNIFNIKLQRTQGSFIPQIVLLHEQLKDQQIWAYNQSIVRLVQQIQVLVDQRKGFNKKILEFIQICSRNLSKNMLSDMRNSLDYLNKIKKPISQAFGQQTFYLLKSIQGSFDLSISMNQKMIKKEDSIIIKINNEITEYSKQLDKFFKQFNSQMEKFFSKKEVRSLFRNSTPVKSSPTQQKQMNSFTQQEIQKYKTTLRLTMKQVIKSFTSFHQKLDRIDVKIKTYYIQLCLNTIDFQSCLHKAMLDNYNNYFNQQNFLSNYKKFQQQITKISQNQDQFFKNSIFGPLKTDKSKLTIDLQKHKFQQFLKLKKPVDNFQTYRQTMGSPTLARNTSSQKKNDAKQQIFQLIKQQTQQGSLAETNILPSKQQVLQKKQSKHKYQQLIRSKIMFKQGENILDCYTCSLSDKINLHGRLFVTNIRLCFYSRFNPNNVFFGGTLIQIPKEYILKIQKKKALFMNGLLLTTIHGDVSFIGFYNRDEVYDLIISTFQMNVENQFLQQNDEENQICSEQQLKLPMEDDLNEQQALQRKLILEKRLENGFKFEELYRTQINKLNAYQLFKTFFSDQQILVNKRAYSCFQEYVKTCLQYTDIDMQSWSPPLKQFLNPTIVNIKSSAPQIFKRIIKCTVPLKSGGVPFLPKTVQSIDEEQLYLFQRNSWIIQSKACTSGAPYTDCFQVYVKIKVDSKSQNSCTMVVQCYINFIKSTMMKSVIQEKAKVDVIAAAKKRTEQINKYIKYIENIKNKNKGGVGVNIQEMQEQFQKEKSQLVQKNQELTQKINFLQQETAKFKKILIALGIINLILIVFLIF